MARQRPRPPRNRPPTPQAQAPRAAAAKPRPAWRETIDSFGGITTVLILAAAVVGIIAMVVVGSRNSGGGAISDAPLMGEHIATGGEGNHVGNEAQLIIPAGQPPVGGPHFGTPQAPGAYDGPVPEGNVLHSLEHGIVWISYNPSKLDEAAVKRLKDLQKKYSRDLILSPRPANTMAIAAASWEQLLKQDTLDTKQLEQFVKTNRNRAPEPGVR